VGVAYRPTRLYARTPEERADQATSWARPDHAFFAAGACHVLAWSFLDAYPDAGFLAVGLRVVGHPNASHVYVSDGTWAFDHNGWTYEAELLAVTRADYATHQPGAVLERLALGFDLAAFCAAHNSRLPAQYAHDPRPRARSYLARFPPPVARGKAAMLIEPGESWSP
jgi:hypothetical protein